MNCNIYFFRKDKSSLNLFPENYVRDIVLGAFPTLELAPNQRTIALIRSAEIVYVVYNYACGDCTSFGFCLEYNRTYPSNVSYLFRFFDSLVAKVIGKGKLLRYNAKGNVVVDSSPPIKHCGELDETASYIDEYLNDSMAEFKDLPTINLSVDQKSAFYYYELCSSAKVAGCFKKHSRIVFVNRKSSRSLEYTKIPINGLSESFQVNKGDKKNTKHLEANTDEQRQQRDVALSSIIESLRVTPSKHNELRKTQQSLKRIKSRTQKKGKRNPIVLLFVTCVLLLLAYIILKGTSEQIINNEDQKALIAVSDYIKRDFVLVSGEAVDSFYICKYEVTQKDYVALMGNNPSKYQGDSLPVHGMSVRDAILYCNKKSMEYGLDGFYKVRGKNVTLKKDGNGFRLPTEREWVFAALKDNGYIDDIAWYGKNSGGMPQSVKTRRSNSLGIYDIWGNICELCVRDDGQIWGKGGSYRIRIKNQFDKSKGFFASKSISSTNTVSDEFGLRLVYIPPKQ